MTNWNQAAARYHLLDDTMYDMMDEAAEILAKAY